MSLLYKELSEIITSVDIKQEDGYVEFLFSCDGGKFGTDEMLAEFKMTPKEIFEAISNYYQQFGVAC